MDVSKQIVSARKSGPDIVRTIAVLLVFLTHSLTYLVNFETQIESPKWYISVFLHFVSITCVPLFLLLTGYLCKDKRLSGRYFLGIIPVILSYFVIAAVTAFATNYGGMTVYSFVDALRAILNFTAINYAWYVEMYIGLFLLIPFLNILWHGLEDTKKRIILIGVLCFMTATVQFFKSFRPQGITLDIIPDYWENIYPVTYYFLGAFISEYKPKINKAIMFGVAFLAYLLPFVICILMSSPEKGYAWYVMNGFSCITTAFAAVCLFLCFYDINLPKVPSAIFKEISVCSFEMYLWSYCVDLWLYNYLPVNKPTLPILSELHTFVYQQAFGRFFALPLMILIVFFITYILSRITRICLYPLNKLIKIKK